MRIINLFKYTMMLFLTLLSTKSLATPDTTPQIPSFIPGNYALINSSGHPDAAEFCLDGDFNYSESGKQILLGPKHGFSLKNTVTKTVATDDPEEKGCVYENSNTFSPSADNSLLASKEVLKCDGEDRHMFTETAIITKGRVHLEFKQTNSASAVQKGEKNISYKCTWELKTRSAASVKKRKSK